MTGKVSFTCNEGGGRCGRVALVQVLQLGQEVFLCGVCFILVVLSGPYPLDNNRP